MNIAYLKTVINKVWKEQRVPHFSRGFLREKWDDASGNEIGSLPMRVEE
jgi:hypothetical protein